MLPLFTNDRDHAHERVAVAIYSEDAGSGHSEVCIVCVTCGENTVVKVDRSQGAQRPPARAPVPAGAASSPTVPEGPASRAAAPTAPGPAAPAPAAPAATPAAPPAKAAPSDLGWKLVILYSPKATREFMVQHGWRDLRLGNYDRKVPVGQLQETLIWARQRGGKIEVKDTNPPEAAP